jgi:hypothetical protein
MLRLLRQARNSCSRYRLARNQEFSPKVGCSRVEQPWSLALIACLNEKENAKMALTSEYQIVVLQRGWVVVGRMSKDDMYFIIDDAAVIRDWGTTKGLGQLRNGPTSNTILDAAGVVKAHELTVVFTIDTDRDKWADVLAKVNAEDNPA